METPTRQGRISSIAGFVLSLAVASVSVAVALVDDPLGIELAAARAAVKGASASKVEPALLEDLLAEEVVFYAGGSIGVRAPWLPPPETPYVALARDPVALPTHAGGVGEMIHTGPWVARRMNADAASGVGELPTLLPYARVEILIEGAAPRRCGTFAEGRWRCGPSWNYVGETTVKIANKRERCVWLHPTNEGPLSLTLPGLPADGRFEGRAALADSGAQMKNGSPITLRASVNGEIVYDERIPNGRGWRKVAFDLGGDDSKPVALRLEVSSPSAAKRHFCMQGALRSGEP